MTAAAAVLLFSFAARPAEALTPRYAHSTALLTNGTLLVVGGLDASNTPLATVEIRDTNHGSIYASPPAVSFASSLNFARSSATATVLPSGNVLVTGGWDGASARTDAEVYDPSNNSWTVVSGMSNGRFNHTATLLNTGDVLICGGQTGAGPAVTATCDLFTPLGAGGSFAPTGSLLQARELHTSTLLQDGAVWVAGGWNPGSGYLVTTERYNPGTGAWQQAQPLTASRAYHTATLTGDNKVLVAGGFNGKNFFDTVGSALVLPYPSLGVLGSTELFDPLGGAISPGAPLKARVLNHSSTLLPDGVVDAQGGLGNVAAMRVESFLPPGPTIFGSFSTTAPSPTSGVHTITGGTATVSVGLYLPIPVTGEIIDGEMQFYGDTIDIPQPYLTTADAMKVTFINNHNVPGVGLKADLSGATVSCYLGICGFLSGSFNLSNFAGSAFVLEEPVSSPNYTEAAAVTGQIQFFPPSINIGINSGVADVTDGSFTVHVQIGVPDTFIGHHISTLTLVLDQTSSAQWVEASSYTIKLTGGSGVRTGPFPVLGPIGAAYIDVPGFTFTGITGQLAVTASTSSYTLTSPLTVPLAVARTSSFKPKAYIVADGITLAGTLATKGVDIWIRRMVFGDDEYYDPKTNQWDFEPPNATAPRPGTARFGGSSTLMRNGDVFYIGGRHCASNCAGLTTVSEDGATVWDTAGTIAGTSVDPLKHSLHTASLLTDGTILLAGGTDGSSVLASGEIFDPISNNFTLASNNLQHPRQNHSASLMPNGRVLLAGGFSTTAYSTGPTNTAEIYYPDTKMFLPTSVMPSSHSQHTAITLPDGNVFVAGGYSGVTTVSGAAEIYYSTSGQWTPVASMPALQERAIQASVQLKDGRIALFGGTNQTGNLSSVIAWDPASNAWSSLASMPLALQGHTATLLFDGTVLVAGGDDGFGETYTSMIYDPVGDTWHDTSSTLNDARLGHSATLLPNGDVMISGGVQQQTAISTAASTALRTVEYYHPDAEYWFSPSQNYLSGGARAFHTVTLAPNGQLYFLGGADGAIGAGQGPTFYKAFETDYFTLSPDQYSLVNPSLRQSTVTFISPSPVAPASLFTITGQRFRGGTEASGGAAGPAQSSFNSPRLMLQKIDGSGGGGPQSSPGFVADMTAAIYANSANWSTLDTNFNVQLPATNAALPIGWYNAWVGSSDIHTARAPYVQIGPPKPLLAPTAATGVALGISSISWTWGAISGIDGYNVYQATGGVFLGTAPVSGTPSFIQRNLGFNTAVQIRVAGFTITGDGPSTLSTLAQPRPLSTVNSVGCGSLLTGDSPTSIVWTWSDLGSVDYYKVYNSTMNPLVLISTTPSGSATFHDVGLGTNTPRAISVSAVISGAEGPISAGVTCVTQAAPPTPGLPVMTSTEPTSVALNWLANQNPPNTPYVADLYTTANSTISFVTLSTTGLRAYFSGLLPGSYNTAYVYALNSLGVQSAPLVAGSTYTLPAQPQNVLILKTTPTSLTMSWNQNSNSPTTIYQVTYSTDDFITNTSTAIPFSANFGGSSTTITGLLTSTPYWVTVRAQNPYGQLSNYATPAATATFNGGATYGSLAGVLTALGASELSGSLGNGRLINLRSPGGAFPSDTTVTISSYDVTTTLCPNGLNVAVSIAESPAFQPTRPLYLTASYAPSEIGALPLAQLVLARYDPATGVCVPLETSFDSTAQTFTARLNHFSLYQLVLIPLATTADSARVYPNPYRSASDGYVTVDQVPPGARVRIMTLRGDVVLDQAANGSGLLTWSAANGSGRPVASGLYLVVIESSGSKKIMKLAVIR
jgi:N-acetylneuraminic acid mutarotase